MSCAASRRATNCRSQRAPRKSSNAPCRAGSDMELLSIAAVLLGVLALLLGAGVWIAVALMATGWAGMQFAGGGIPAGSVLATTVWRNSASWSLAALPLFIWMGEILFALIGGNVSRVCPLAELAAGPAHVRQRARLWRVRFGVGIIGRDLRHGCQDRPAGTEETRL